MTKIKIKRSPISQPATLFCNAAMTLHWPYFTSEFNTQLSDSSVHTTTNEASKLTEQFTIKLSFSDFFARHQRPVHLQKAIK